MGTGSAFRIWKRRSAFPAALVAWAALGIALNIGLARFTYGVMLPALKRDLSLDYFGGGALNAVHLLGYLTGTLVAPRLARRLGMPRLSRWAHWLVAAGALACAFAPASPALGPALLAAGRVLTGLGAGAGVVAIFVLAFAAVPAASRAFVSGLVWSGMGVALVLSGIAASALLETQTGWRIAFGVSAALAALVALGFPPRRARSAAPPAAGEGSRLRAGQLLSPRWIFLLGVYFTFGGGYISYSTFAGARLAEGDARLGVVSAMWIAFGAAMVVGAAASAGLVRFEGRRRIALVAAALAGAVGAALSWSDAAGMTLAGALLVGLGVAATPTIVSAYARERCSAADYPQAFSYATAAMGLGQFVGPLAAGALADRFGVAAVALFASAVYAVGAALAVLDALRALPELASGASSDVVEDGQ